MELLMYAAYPAAALVVLLILGIPQYMMLRSRNNRAEVQDPQLGRKFIYGQFQHFAILLLLVGLTISAYDFANYFFEPLVEAQEARKKAKEDAEQGMQPMQPMVAPSMSRYYPPIPIPPVLPIPNAPPVTIPPIPETMGDVVQAQGIVPVERELAPMPRPVQEDVPAIPLTPPVVEPKPQLPSAMPKPLPPAPVDPLTSPPVGIDAGMLRPVDQATLNSLKPKHIWWNKEQRLAAGLVTSGLMHALLLAFVLRFTTNAKHFHSVAKSFVGQRLYMAGLLMMALSTVTFVMLYQEGESDYTNLGKLVGVAAVWGPATLVHFVWMYLYREKKVIRMEESEEEDEG